MESTLYPDLSKIGYIEKSYGGTSNPDQLRGWRGSWKGGKIHKNNGIVSIFIFKLTFRGDVM